MSKTNFINIQYYIKFVDKQTMEEEVKKEQLEEGKTYRSFICTWNNPVGTLELLYEEM